MLIAILIGILVGLISALLGLGGNILIVPLLPLAAGIPIQEVVATGIFTVFFITLVNSIFFLKAKLLDTKTAFLLVPPTILGSFLGAYLSTYIDEGSIKALLIGIMILMIVRLNWKSSSTSLQVPFKKTFIVLCSAISGVIAGLTGIGTGVILGPVLLAFQLIESRKLSPTINLLIAVSCLSASLNYLLAGEISWPQVGKVHLDWSMLILVPAFLSSFLGRSWNNRIPDRWRKGLLSLILATLVLKLVIV